MPILAKEETAVMINRIMMTAPTPKNEASRLEALRQYQILDTEPEKIYDDITYLASLICRTSISTITFIDEKRQWFKSRVGMPATEGKRDNAFCAHAILETGVMIVPDAKMDQRFFDNPYVTSDPYIRFYAGAPLVTSEGFALGTLCVIDQKPHEMTSEEKKALEALGRLALSQLELRRTSNTLVKLNETLLQEISLRKELQEEKKN